MKKKIKICLISSSGGHYEQLSMLKKLKDRYDVYIITEKTDYETECKYTLSPSSKNKLLSYIKFALNILKSLYLFIKERPDVVISTGSRVAIPTVFFAHLFKKKVIYIETFARVHDGTRAAKLVYKYHLYDMFVYQWKQLEKLYPDGVYGGGIY